VDRSCKRPVEATAQAQHPRWADESVAQPPVRCRAIGLPGQHHFVAVHVAVEASTGLAPRPDRDAGQLVRRPPRMKARDGHRTAPATRSGILTRCFAPELRVRSQALVVSSDLAGLERKTPQRTPHVEHAVTDHVTGCRRTSQCHECSVPDWSGASLVALAFGQEPGTGHSRHHAVGQEVSHSPCATVARQLPFTASARRHGQP
jgi:hypothetical protein